MADKAWAGPNPPLFFFRRMFRHLLLLFPVLCLSSASPTWTVKDGDSTCLIIQADITGEIHWILKNSSFTFPWKFNNTIGTTGSCNAKTASSGLKCTNVGLSLEFGSFMTLGNLRAVAFADIKGDDFPKQQVYEVCELDSRTSDVVPIIVGAALACLVVVVLVAYLVGRHRARTLGYGSV